VVSFFYFGPLYRAYRPSLADSNLPASEVPNDVLNLIKQESLANAKVTAREPCWSKTDFDVK